MHQELYTCRKYDFGVRLAYLQLLLRVLNFWNFHHTTSHTLDKSYSMSLALQPAPPGPVLSVFSLIGYAFGLVSETLLLLM